MKDEGMCWDAPGPFSMATEATDTATSKPIPQECVGKVQTYDISMGSSQIMGDEKGLEIKSCLGTNDRTVRNRPEKQSCKNNYVRNICEHPRMGYSEAVKRGLTNNALRLK